MPRDKEIKMANGTVRDRLMGLLNEQFPERAGAICNETRFVEDLGADGLDFIEIAMKGEDEFGIMLPDNEVEKLRTVGQAVEYLTARLGEPKT